MSAVVTHNRILVGFKPIDDLHREFEAIIETAKNHGCDVIFMASHGRRGLSAVLLGSETQKVLTHSSIPVMVYR